MSLRRFIAVAIFLTALLLGSSAAFAGQTIYNINQMPGWQSCNVCAGAGGNGPAVPYSTTQWERYPSLDGASQEFWIGGATPYSSALWWKQLTPDATAHNFRYDFWVYLVNSNAPQALEFDVNQSVDGKKFIFGTECDFNGTHQWNVWDDYNQRWGPTGLGCAKFTPYSWNHFVLQFQRTSNDLVYYAGVQINGVQYYFNRTFAPRPVNASELNVAVQLDGNWQEQNYSIWVDKMNLVYW